MAKGSAAGMPGTDKAKSPATAQNEATGEIAGEGVRDEGAGDDNEDGDVSSVIADRIENIADEVQLNTSTLRGDLRDTILDLFKTRPKPWSAMGEDEQKTVAKAIDFAADSLVRKAVTLIVASGDGAFYAKLESYSEKGGIKISLTAEPTKDVVLACHDAAGANVIIRRADPAPFSGQRGDVETDPDQPGMQFEGDRGDARPAPPADNSDLAMSGGFGVWDGDEQLWLEQDGENWTPEKSDAGSWPEEQANTLAAEKSAEAVDLDIEASDT